MPDLTPEKLAELRQLLHSGPRDCADSLWPCRTIRALDEEAQPL